MTEDVHFMQCALDEARKAAGAKEVPVGAVAVREGRIVGRAHNAREGLNDPTAHAEILLVRKVAWHLHRWRLHDVTVYVTLEPCSMCAGALVLARVARLVFGAYDPKGGAAGSLFTLTESEALNHRIPTVGGVLAHSCGTLLRTFFRLRRRERQLGRDGREVEGGRFEICCAGDRTGGSNPSLSASVANDRCGPTVAVARAWDE